MATSERELSPDELGALASRMVCATEPAEQQRLIVQLIDGFYGDPAASPCCGERTCVKTVEHEAVVAAIRLSLRYAAAARTLPGADKRVLAAAHRVFIGWDAVVEWLTAPAPALGGRVPLEVTGEGPAGVEEVLGLLAGIAHGHVQ